MKFIIIALALVCGAYALPTGDGPKCQAPNGGGLMPVLKEFVALIPKDQIVEIYMNAVSNDAEVQEFMEYLSSEEFAKIVMTVRNLPEFNVLNDFFCTKLYFDAIYYQNRISEIIGLPTIPQSISIEPRTRAGFHGMLMDMIDIIPVDKVRELFKRKAESDEYVKMAIELIKSKDFHNVVEALHSQPEYNKLKEGLKQKGFKVDEVIAFVKKYLGLN